MNREVADKSMYTRLGWVIVILLLIFCNYQYYKIDAYQEQLDSRINALSDEDSADLERKYFLLLKQAHDERTLEKNEREYFEYLRNIYDPSDSTKPVVIDDMLYFSVRAGIEPDPFARALYRMFATGNVQRMIRGELLKHSGNTSGNVLPSGNVEIESGNVQI